MNTDSHKRQYGDIMDILRDLQEQVAELRPEELTTIMESALATAFPSKHMRLRWTVSPYFHLVIEEIPEDEKQTDIWNLKRQGSWYKRPKTAD